MRSILRTSSKVSKQFGAYSKRSYSDWPHIKDDHRMVMELCRNFANEELVPIAGKLDKEHRFPKEQVAKLGEMGMMGVYFDEKYGGSNMDVLSYAIAMEEISRGCASTGVIMSANNSLYCAPVDMFGSHEQKLQFLTPVASGW